MSWEEKLDYITNFRHLPGIDPASKMLAGGLEMGQNFIGLLGNVEENTLDIIELFQVNLDLKKQVEVLSTENLKLREKLSELENRILILEN